MPPAGAEQGSPPHSHRCTRTYASIPASVCWSLSVPSSGATPGQAGGPCSGVLRLVGLGNSVVGARRGEGLAKGARVGWGRCQLDSWTERPRLAHSHVAPVAGVCVPRATSGGPRHSGHEGEGRPTQSRVLSCSARAGARRSPVATGQHCAPCRPRTLGPVPTPALSTPRSAPPSAGLRAGQRCCQGWRHTDSAHRVASRPLRGSRAGAGRPVGRLRSGPGPGTPCSVSP